MRNIFVAVFHRVIPINQNTSKLGSSFIEKEEVQDLNEKYFSAVSGGPQVDNDPEG